MLEPVALLMLSLCWMSLAFGVLQFATTGHHLGAAASLVVTVVGIALVLTHGGTYGFGWLRALSLRSDALAIGAIVPTLALLVGGVTARMLRVRWYVATATLSALCCAGTGTIALAIGRASWYWEFVAVGIAGIMLVAVGGANLGAPDASADARVVTGAIALFGVILTVGGVILLITSQTIVS